jgi:hypothetical protein
MPVTEMVEWRELRWFVHLIGMDNNRKPRQIWGRRVEAVLVRGRVRIEWEEHFPKM